MAAVTICSDFGAQKNKVSHCFHCFPVYLPWSDRTRCHDLHFLMLSFKPAFSLSHPHHKALNQAYRWYSVSTFIFIHLFHTPISISFHSSVQFSRLVVSDSFRPHESQHARPPCPSPTPGVHSDSHPSSEWCHPAISSSVIPFSCPQSLPASDSFPMSQLFAWGGQSTAVSALVSFLPKKSQADLLQNGLVGSPCSPRGSQQSSPTPHFKSINSPALSLLHSTTLTSIHDHRKNHSLD